eukprot:483377_1
MQLQIFHDLTWGTRLINQKLMTIILSNNNPKYTTIKIILITLFFNIITSIILQPWTQYIHILFFGLITLPSLYQIFFTVIWLAQTSLIKLYSFCKPKKITHRIRYTGFTNINHNNDNNNKNIDINDVLSTLGENVERDK